MQKAINPYGDKLDHPMDIYLSLGDTEERQQSVNDRLELEKTGTQEWLDLKKQAIELDAQAEVNSATKARDEAIKRVEESAAANIITEEQKSQMLIEKDKMKIRIADLKKLR